MKQTRILKTFSFALASLLACAATIHAQRTVPPTKAELAEITERGRELAAYDAAAWRGTDAVVALRPKEGSVARYIARRTPSGWRVAFGRFNEKKDGFIIEYEAVQGAGANDYTAKHHEPPLVVKDFYLFAARAIDTALADFKGAPRAYNVAVLPAKAEQLWVYVVPAQTQADIFPLGGDVRYLVSKDGGKIVERRQLHNAIIENEPPPRGAEPKAGVHSAILDDIPEDTDVFHVLVRLPRIPELVVTRKYVYQINTDGTIDFLGKSEDVIGKQPSPR